MKNILGNDFLLSLCQLCQVCYPKNYVIGKVPCFLVPFLYISKIFVSKILNFLRIYKKFFEIKFVHLFFLFFSEIHFATHFYTLIHSPFIFSSPYSSPNLYFFLIYHTKPTRNCNFPSLYYRSRISGSGHWRNHPKGH